MRKKSAIALRKSDDSFHVEHRGYPSLGLVPFHATLGLATVCLLLNLTLELEPLSEQLSLALACSLVLFACCAYLLLLPFAAMGGKVSFNPKEQSIQFSRSILGRQTDIPRRIPWQDELEIEVDQVGIKTRALPLSYFRVKIVTDFMTFPVATFGPGMGSVAEKFSKALRKARNVRPTSSIVEDLQRDRTALL